MNIKKIITKISSFYKRISYRFCILFIPSVHLPVIVTFTGGMGAQLASAAIYFNLKREGRKVFADLSYFDTPPHYAKPGSKGDISHWDWQLSYFGLELTTFERLPVSNLKCVEVISDGSKKAYLAFQALRIPEIQKKFPLNSRAIAFGQFEILSSSYLCIHIRRGDYVNVAEHLISDNDFINIAIKFSNVMSNLIVLSDSTFDIDLKKKITGYKHIFFVDNSDPFTAHTIMRNANILVCSNSQFSLTAALLNDNGLIFLPKNWFGKNRKLNKQISFISRSCNFELLS